MTQRHASTECSIRETGRIVFLIDEMKSLTAGGTERQLLQMLRIAQACGWSPSVCILRGTDWLTEEMAGCPVKRLRWSKLASLTSPGHAVRAARWLRAERFDAMQTVFPESNLIGPVLAKLVGIPTVLGTRRNLTHVSTSPFNPRTQLQILSNLLVKGILANSEAVLRRTHTLERTPLRKLFVLYNGIDLEQMAPRPELRNAMRKALGIGERELLVGNLSGLRPIKGIDLFIDAAVLARQQAPHLRFVVIGEGVLHQEIEALVSARGLSSVFRVAGPSEDVRPHLAAMDIAVLCSKAEGFSNSLLEYMAAGLPTVATDVGGNREALGGSGLLIPSNDAPALARAICSLLDPVRRRALGESAQRAVQRFDFETARKNTGELYRKLLRPRVTSGSPAHLPAAAAAGLRALPETAKESTYGTTLRGIDPQESR